MKRLKNPPLEKAYLQSKIGLLEIAADDKGLTSIQFVRRKSAPGGKPSPLLRQCVRQMREYFAGKRRKFTVKISQPGTAFQRRVWQALRGIPHGKTTSYKTIGQRIGRVKALRAVGSAIGRNALPIVVPCHRVIGHDGRLSGFACGVHRKKWLLEHEKAL